MLAYLSRYTHRIAIANGAKAAARYKLMRLDVNEFIRRFPIHVLPGLRWGDNKRNGPDR